MSRGYQLSPSGEWVLFDDDFPSKSKRAKKDGPFPLDILKAHAGDELASTLLSELNAYGYAIVRKDGLS